MVIDNSKDIEKTFLIVNMACFGDVLLTNSLCQNLKIEFPNSKIVFLVNKPFVEVAKYQHGVDDVIYMDKHHKHKGLSGLIKFALSCKYRNKIDAAFIVYGNPRGIIISKLLGAKKIVSKPPQFIKFLVSNIPEDDKTVIKAQEINAHLFQGYTLKKEKVLPIKYKTNPQKNFITTKLVENYKNKEIIGLCCISKTLSKDMPIEEAIKLINKLNEQQKIILFLGSGMIARTYADNLKKRGCTNFVDLTNITSIYDLANILKKCKCLISVDTGTMHLGYAVGCFTICVFFQKNTARKWAPDETLYDVKVIDNKYSLEKVISYI